jgi:4-diphosphocytidyl-2-C-methyl-D-erythritol kinase
MIKLLSALAPAKVNLFLRVTGRRADGYHEIDSIFAPISLYDQIGIGVRPGASPAVWLRCDWEGLGPDHANLAVRAAAAFLAEFGLDAEVMIDLHKQIPPGAGLGGGSSDAGAVLQLLADLYQVDDRSRMETIAISLGADVPFFLSPLPSRVRGIGEQREPLANFTPLDLVVAVPPITVATAEVFRALRPDGWSGPAAPDVAAAFSRERIDSTMLVNDLTPIAIARYPVIAELRRAFEGAGALGASMSGSGGAVFGIFATPADASRAAGELRRVCPAARVFAATTIAGVAR